MRLKIIQRLDGQWLTLLQESSRLSFILGHPNFRYQPGFWGEYDFVVVSSVVLQRIGQIMKRLQILCNVLGSFGSAQVWNHWLQEAGATLVGTGARGHAGSQGNVAGTAQGSGKRHGAGGVVAAALKHKIPAPILLPLHPCLYIFYSLLSVFGSRLENQCGCVIRGVVEMT